MSNYTMADVETLQVPTERLWIRAHYCGCPHVEKFITGRGRVDRLGS
jgi:hypothetical protein